MVMNEVNAALLKMFASSADVGGTETPAGYGETPEAGGMGLGSLQALGAVDEEIESGSEVRLDKAAKFEAKFPEKVFYMLQVYYRIMCINVCV